MWDFVVDKVGLGSVFSEYFGFPCPISFDQLLQKSSSFIICGLYNRPKWPQYQGLRYLGTWADTLGLSPTPPIIIIIIIMSYCCILASCCSLYQNLFLVLFTLHPLTILWLELNPFLFFPNLALSYMFALKLEWTAVVSKPTAVENTNTDLSSAEGSAAHPNFIAPDDGWVGRIVGGDEKGTQCMGV
jgi:hypothetical protein